MKQRILNKIKKILNIGNFDSLKSLGEIRNFLNTTLCLRKGGSYDTRYSQPITLENGKTLTIRLANHQAVEQNFIAHNNTEYNISIIICNDTETITITTNKVRTSQIYEEIIYTSECFTEYNIKQTIFEILQGFVHALENGGTFLKGEMGKYLVHLDNNLNYNNMIYTNDYDFLKMLCSRILSDNFDYRKYSNGFYFGRKIQTQELFCSYGQIGFKVFVDDYYEISYDWELGEIDINDEPMKQFFENYDSDLNGWENDTLKRLKKEYKTYYEMVEWCIDGKGLIHNEFIIEELSELGLYFDAYCGKYYDKKNDEYAEIYQHFIISESAAERFETYTNEIVLYNEVLDLYILGVTHFGMAWKGIDANWKRRIS